MNKFLIGAVSMLAIGAATGSIVAASGIINVAANEAHGSFLRQTLEFARERSIAKRLSEISVPADFADPERVRRGAGNYAAMCVVCHLAPEAPDSELRKGLYPRPPNLSLKPGPASASRSAARDFWIIKNGIKASGMPAWSAGGMDDGAIWDLAAFLQKMPLLAKSDYEQLVAASDGHAHGGAAEHGSHDHSSHKH